MGNYLFGNSLEPTIESIHDLSNELDSTTVPKLNFFLSVMAMFGIFGIAIMIVYFYRTMKPCKC